MKQFLYLSKSFAAVVLSLVIPIATGGAVSQEIAQQTEDPEAHDTLLWSYDAVQKISFYRITETGNLIVATANKLAALDPETGERIWIRNDVRNLKEAEFDILPLTPYAAVRSKNDIALLDLGSGTTMWDSKDIPLKKVRGYFSVLEHNMMLVYGESAKSKKTLIAADLETGKLRWLQGGLFKKKPSLEEIDGIHTLWGHQMPLLDTDTTMILFISKDGPIKIHVETGELIWRVDELEGKALPLLSRWYAPIMLVDGILLVPYKKKLMAIDASDGSVVWDRYKNFESPIAQMEYCQKGLLVRGMRPLDKEKGVSLPKAFLDLLDLETGKSIWPKPFTEMKKKSTAPFLVENDKVYFSDKNHFFTINLKDGLCEEPVTYKFEGGEEPAVLEKRGDEFMLLSEHNLMLLDHLGMPRLHRYYPKPGKSLLSKIGTVALFVASAAGQAAVAEHVGKGGLTFTPTLHVSVAERQLAMVSEGDKYTFIYTKAPDASGREGFSLVKLRKSDGEEMERLWIEKRSPDYLVDVITGTVFLKSNGRKILALRFPGK